MKQKVFDWNHISTKLTTEQVDELKSYYKAYHRKCWAYKRAVRHYRKWKVIGNSLSLILASGGIASAIATGGIALVAISTTSLLIQGYMKHKELDMKIQNSRYAYQSYQHILNSIKDALRSGNFEISALQAQMRNVDDYVTDTAPMVDKFINKYDLSFG